MYKDMIKKIFFSIIKSCPPPKYKLKFNLQHDEEIQHVYDILKEKHIFM